MTWNQEGRIGCRMKEMGSPDCPIRGISTSLVELSVRSRKDVLCRQAEVLRRDLFVTEASPEAPNVVLIVQFVILLRIMCQGCSNTTVVNRGSGRHKMTTTNILKMFESF